MNPIFKARYDVHVTVNTFGILANKKKPKMVHYSQHTRSIITDFINIHLLNSNYRFMHWKDIRVFVVLDFIREGSRNEIFCFKLLIQIYFHFKYKYIYLVVHAWNFFLSIICMWVLLLIRSCMHVGFFISSPEMNVLFWSKFVDLICQS